MADSLRTQYEIALEIEGQDRIKSDIDKMNKGLRGLSDASRKMDFREADKTAQSLAEHIHELAEGEEDATEQMELFGKAADKAYKDLEASAVKLNHSLSEQGKQQRERIHELEAERATLGQTKEEKARAKEIDRELKELRKDVVDASDDELKDMIKLNVQARSRLKIAQQEAKSYKQNHKQQKTLSKLIKEDLKPLRDKIKAQMEFIKSLRTTEGRYNALKKAAKGAYNVGKSAAKGMGLVLGSILAVTGATIAAAEGQVSKEEQARRLKVGSFNGERQSLIEDVFVEAGGTDEEVVDAINRVYAVLGKDASLEDVKTAAAMELKYPGLSKMFMQQNTGNVTAQDYIAAGNHTRHTQQYSGATKEQIQEASDYISNLRQNKFTNASEMELRDLYLSLQGSGAFDSDEELQRAFNDFVRVQMKSNQDVFDLAKQWQEEGKWIRTAYGATNKTQAMNALKTVDFRMLATNQRMVDYSRSESAAESAAKTARRVSLLKDQVLLQILQGLEPFLKSGALQKLIEMVMRLIQSEEFQKILGLMGDLLGMILDLVAKIAKVVQPFAKSAIDTTLKGSQTIINYFKGKQEEREMETVETSGGTIRVQKHPAPQVGVSGQAHANGGIAAMPSIFGEGVAPEIAIPLDPAREGRAQQLSAYVNNTFNMNGNETSAMALSSALNSREWAYQSARMGALQRRMGR